jgi:anti-sigma factor RsiW
MMAHDDATLAAFVAGDLSAEETKRVDAHVLGCDECWEAIHQNLQGARLAQSLRVRAPTGLAERVEAAVSEASPPSREFRLRWIAAALAVACVAVLVVAVGHRGNRPDPPAIAAIVRLAGAAQGDETSANQVLSGDVAISRERVSGRIVVLATGPRPFPMPVGAHPASAGAADPWIARRGQLTLLCFNGIHPALLVGPVPSSDLLAAARGLGLG